VKSKIERAAGKGGRRLYLRRGRRAPLYRVVFTKGMMVLVALNPPPLTTTPRSNLYCPSLPPLSALYFLNFFFFTLYLVFFLCGQTGLVPISTLQDFPNSPLTGHHPSNDFPLIPTHPNLRGISVRPSIYFNSPTP
jgi:hypothetical protein